MTITAPPPAITTTGICKAYEGRVVLDGIESQRAAGHDLRAARPERLRKTTMVRILSTLISPDDGTASIDGHDLAREAGAVRRSIGVDGSVPPPSTTSSRVGRTCS